MAFAINPARTFRLRRLPPRACNARSPPPPRNPHPQLGRRAALWLLCSFSVGAAAAADADAAPPVTKMRLSEAEWRKRLSPDAYAVLFQAGTERPFTSPLLKEKRKGTFTCAACDQPLFSSRTKYESGTGWPSFWDALPGAIELRPSAMDRMLLRTEVVCSKCDGHLGHVFPDGPRPTGKRYCMNGVALGFEAD